MTILWSVLVLGRSVESYQLYPDEHNIAPISQHDLSRTFNEFTPLSPDWADSTRPFTGSERNLATTQNGLSNVNQLPQWQAGLYYELFYNKSFELDPFVMQKTIWYFEDQSPAFALLDGFTVQADEERQKRLMAATPVPEPGTMILFGIGLVLIAGISKKRLKINC